ncbi:MAG TPA: hypothetical protein VLA99_13085 [Nitrospiraceae bacterium]|nr:hypothetical protein [Nitrospiraceae bacterium]
MRRPLNDWCASLAGRQAHVKRSGNGCDGRAGKQAAELGRLGQGLMAGEETRSAVGSAEP